MIKQLPKRILYTPPRGIGDMVFSLPLLHSLHAAYPEAEIVVPLPGDKQEMIDLVGFIKNSKKGLPKPRDDPLARARWEASARGDKEEKYRLEKLIYENYLAGEKFDLALVPKDFSIDSIDCPMQVNENHLNTTNSDCSGMHMVDRFLGFAKYLGIARKDSFALAVDLNLPSFLHSSGRLLFFSFPYVVFNLGSSLDKKMWDADKFANVASWCADYDLIPVIVGDPASYQNSLQIQQKEPRVCNTVIPKGHAFNLSNFCRLASRSRAVVSPDTGLLHLADASGAKVIGLYGPTSPSNFGPYHNIHNVVSRYDIDRTIHNIPSQDVIAKLEELVL